MPILSFFMDYDKEQYFGVIYYPKNNNQLSLGSLSSSCL